MSAQVTEEIFIIDCKKHNLEPWDFNDQSGPWRDLYLKTRARKKPGRKPHSSFRISLIYHLVNNQKRENPKKKLDAIFEDLAKELNSLREKGKCINSELDVKLTAGKVQGLYEDFKSVLEEAGKVLKKENYYNPKYKSKKLLSEADSILLSKNRTTI